MSDTFVTVLAIGLAAVLVFIMPVTTMAERVDDMSKLDVQTLTSDFVSEVQTTGIITLDRYDTFLQELSTTGNSFDVEMELRVLDENPGKKSAQADRDKIGENTYYSLYTTQIMEEIENPDKNHEKILNEGDLLTVTVKNTNMTLAQQLKNFSLKMSGTDIYTIEATKTGLITRTGNSSTN